MQDTTAEYFIFDGDNVLASYASNGTLNASYLTPGLDANLAMTQGENTYYYFQDGLGSVRNVVDASENVQNTYDYRAFGVKITDSENVTSPYRFTGREWETGGLGVYYYRNRYYYSGFGIFTSRDAMGTHIPRGWGMGSSNKVMLASNGNGVCETVCDTSTGKPEPILKCARYLDDPCKNRNRQKCIEEHEEVHVGQMKKCCGKYKKQLDKAKALEPAARKKAIDDLEALWRKYKGANKPDWEIEAYTEQKKCVKGELKTVPKSEKACCGALWQALGYTEKGIEWHKKLKKDAKDRGLPKDCPKEW